MGISQLLETARRAMMTQQLGMSVTGHNIANANTPGFSRQRAEVVTTPPVLGLAGLMGTGVTVQGVVRLRDRFLDTQIRSAGESMGRASMEYRVLRQIESVLNEPSDSSLNSAIERFFNSWQDLSTRPEDSVARTSVMQEGELLSNTFRRLSSDLTTYRASMLEELRIKVDRINMLAQEIAGLDATIVGASVSGEQVADVRDQRDLKLEELSLLAPVSAFEDSRGSITISLGGVVIVSGTSSTPLDVRAAPAATFGGSSFNQVHLVMQNGDGAVSVTGGEVGGLLSAYNSILPEHLGKLDQLARGLITAVNEVHVAGYGRGTPPPTGINFFQGTSASGIAIDLTDTSSGAAAGSAPRTDNIAAAAGPPPPSAGDNRVALTIASLVGMTRADLDGVSIADFYTRLVSGLGVDINAAESLMSAQELVLSQLDSQRNAISGVSLDEEMTNLIKYQRAFDAAAKMVATADEMFQTILSMV
jgi:flagellar hook-associated protein 1 FlgK